MSDYLTLSNGTRLAYDLILPTKSGVACDRPLPVLFKYTPYLRTFTIFDEDGKDIISPLYQMPWVQRTYLRLRGKPLPAELLHKIVDLGSPIL